jgi:hypothetical protein
VLSRLTIVMSVHFGLDIWEGIALVTTSMVLHSSCAENRVKTFPSKILCGPDPERAIISPKYDHAFDDRLAHEVLHLLHI